MLSVQKPLACLFPPAGGAPLVPVLDAVNFATLLRFATDFPAQESQADAGTGEAESDTELGRLPT